MQLQELRERTNPWVAPISEDAPAGKDARYEPEHESLRSEVAKLESPSGGEIDWQSIVRTGTGLLEQKSKDLLVAAYVAFGLYQLEGLEGLARGLVLLTDMMEQHWEGLHPPAKRLRARANALSWLLERVNLHLPETQVGQGDHDAVEVLDQAAQEFQRVAREKLEDNAPAIRPLLEAVERLKMSLPERPAEPSGEADVSAQQQQAPAAEQPAASSSGDGAAARTDGQGASADTGQASSSSGETASPEQTLLERIEPWLQPISEDAPAGTDARYEPEHEELRNEVAQLESPAGGAINWQSVVDRGAGLLTDKSKDLLIAAYVAYGLYETRGLDGLATGLALVTTLQERYWETLQPPLKRIRGRANAISWLMGRLETRLPETELTADDGPALERLAHAANRFAEVTRGYLEDRAPALRPLVETVQRLQMTLPAKEPEPEPEPEPAPAESSAPASQPAAESPPASSQQSAPSEPQPAAAPASMPSAPSASLADASQIVDFLREIGNSLVEAAGVLRRASAKDPHAYRIHRVGLYLHILQPPPIEQGSRTAVPPPSSELRQQLEALTKNEKWEALLDEAESALSGPSRLSLDLQRYVAMALAGLGQEYAAARAEVVRGTAALVQRLPGLLELEFNDGTPLAGEATRSWLETEVLAGGGGGGGDGASEQDPAEASIAEARKLAAGGKGNEALELLQNAVQGTSNGRAQFRARVAMARACTSVGKNGVARGLYASLMEEADSRSLYDWEPSLVAEALTGYHECLKALANEGKAVTQEADLVYRRLTWVDPLAAMKVSA